MVPLLLYLLEIMLNPFNLSLDLVCSIDVFTMGFNIQLNAFSSMNTMWMNYTKKKSTYTPPDSQISPINEKKRSINDNWLPLVLFPIKCNMYWIGLTHDHHCITNLICLNLFIFCCYLDDVITLAFHLSIMNCSTNPSFRHSVEFC